MLVQEDDLIREFKRRGFLDTERKLLLEDFQKHEFHDRFVAEIKDLLADEVAKSAGRELQFKGLMSTIERWANHATCILLLKAYEIPSVENRNLFPKLLEFLSSESFLKSELVSTRIASKVKETADQIVEDKRKESEKSIEPELDANSKPPGPSSSTSRAELLNREKKETSNKNPSEMDISEDETRPRRKVGDQTDNRKSAEPSGRSRTPLQEPQGQTGSNGEISAVSTADAMDVDVEKATRQSEPASNPKLISGDEATHSTLKAAVATLNATRKKRESVTDNSDLPNKRRGGPRKNVKTPEFVMSGDEREVAENSEPALQFNTVEVIAAFVPNSSGLKCFQVRVKSYSAETKKYNVEDIAPENESNSAHTNWDVDENMLFHFKNQPKKLKKGEKCFALYKEKETGTPSTEFYIATVLKVQKAGVLLKFSDEVDTSNVTLEDILVVDQSRTDIFDGIEKTLKENNELKAEVAEVEESKEAAPAEQADDEKEDEPNKGRRSSRRLSRSDIKVEKAQPSKEDKADSKARPPKLSTRRKSAPDFSAAHDSLEVPSPSTRSRPARKSSQTLSPVVSKVQKRRKGFSSTGQSTNTPEPEQEREQVHEQDIIEHIFGGDSDLTDMGDAILISASVLLRTMFQSKLEFNPFPNYTFSGKLRPVYPMSPVRQVPSHIGMPDYALTGEPKEEVKHRKTNRIYAYTQDEIEKARTVCRIAREALEEGAKAAKVGAMTDEIDRVVHEAIIGIPDRYELQDGDILNIDVSVFKDGLHADLNATYLIGNVDPVGKKLVETTRLCLDKAIEICKPGVLYRDIGNTIQGIADTAGFSVFTIEPMISEGTYHDAQWPDNWTIVTRDGKRSAQFEETLLITDTGVEVLTAPII
ncbi:Methionine aminopeptidase 1 [Phlyctochytrium planicorne]|nr:Methionine aminopeptidase 1 [Phlyctochytrium planicorne]